MFVQEQLTSELPTSLSSWDMSTAALQNADSFKNNNINTFFFFLITT